MPKRGSLLLLPGLLCDRQLWRHQIETMGDVADITVPDLTGGSTMADLAASVLVKAPERFALAGLSMGGYIAQEIMRQAPDRVERLALIDTNFTADTPEQTERRRALITMSKQGQFKGVTDRLLPLLIHADRLKDKVLTDTVKAMAEGVGKAAFLRQQSAIMGRPDGTRDLHLIRCPTLVMCGREDALTPLAAHVAMASHIPNGRLVVIERSGHLSPLEQPEAVSGVLRYWLQV
jgi:pimeloyl-ACP methyl ester carboxylesterase